MSIYGIGSSGVGRPNPLPLPARDNPRAPGQPSMTRAPAQTPLVRQTPAAASTPGSVPSEAPAGTDPALWSVLSGEERAFFAKAGAMGPLTYGRAFTEMKSAQMPANRGGRLDVKI
jgi:hypothetical protein